MLHKIRVLLLGYDVYVIKLSKLHQILADKSNKINSLRCYKCVT